MKTQKDTYSVTVNSDGRYTRAQLGDMIAARMWSLQGVEGGLTDVVTATPGGEHAIDMVLFCPRCGMQHIDKAEPERGWNNEPHKSHLCKQHEGGCGFVWRPADVPTNGVKQTVTKSIDDTDFDLNYPQTIMMVGSEMVRITTTVRGINEWGAIPEIWLNAMRHRDELLFRLEGLEK